jgi:glucokinase
VEEKNTLEFSSKTNKREKMKEVVAGIDIGGTTTVFGLVEKAGNIIADGGLITADYPEVKDFVKALAAGIRNLLKSCPDTKLSAIGIGAPNANYHRGTIELAPNLAWKGIIPFGEYITEEFNLPVKLTNDANAAALGEMIFGNARGMKDFIILTLGTGLGSGIVVNGKVAYGHSGFAGELGHTTIVPGGRSCGCGRKGCLETYASATGLVRTVIELLSVMREETPLRDIPPSELTSRIIADAALKDDPVAVRAMNDTAEKLGFGIINAIVFSSPEAVFLFGGLSNAGDMLFIPVRKYVEENIQPIFRGTYRILPSGIPENNAAVVGSAALAWFEIG